MHHFKQALAAFAVVTMLFTVFFTGTASAQTIHSSSAHQRIAPSACSNWVEDSKPITDSTGSFLGVTRMWEHSCNGTVTGNEQTEVAQGLIFPESASICNGTICQNLQNNNAQPQVSTPSIPWANGGMSGYGCIDGPAGWACSNNTHG